MLDTVQATPRSTIIPAQAHSTGGGRAMAELAGLSTARQLVPGELLGEGGMGVVRAAEQVALGRTVAVKTLKPGRQNPGAALDLLREAWVTGSLEHPNIVPVHYLELDAAGMPTIVLKRIAGVDWSTLCHDGEAVARRFGTTDLLAWNLDILLAILDAVRFAHARGIVHRDLKPSNVMIGDFGEVYLLDWGIAVALVDDGSGRLPLAANATEIAGTPCYLAPEMIGGADATISARTDVYLAGAVLYELITGSPPHLGETALAVLTSVAVSEPKLPDDVPGELAAICLRAMARRPADRFPTADAMRLAIQAYLAHRGSTTLGEKAAARLVELKAILADDPRPPTNSDDEAVRAALDAAEAERREAIYRLFGACRFGFHEALAVWHDNVDATRGVREATLAVAGYELATGNPRAALALVGELAATPEVAAFVTRARAAADAAKHHAAALEKLRVQHDVSVGRRTRGFLTGILGIAFTIAPIVGALLPFDIGFGSHAGTVIWSAISLVIVLGAIRWARETMLHSTLFNRRIAMTGILLFAMQILLSSGAWLAAMSLADTHLLMLLLWGTITWMLAITLDPWLAPTGVGYALAFLAVSWHPESRLYIMAAANFTFAINAMVRWRPATVRMTPGERAWWERQRRRRPG